MWQIDQFTADSQVGSGRWHTPVDFESRPVGVSAYAHRLAPTLPTADSNFDSAEYSRLTPTIELAISAHLPTNANFQLAVGDIGVCLALVPLDQKNRLPVLN